MKDLLAYFLKQKGLYETVQQRIHNNYVECAGYDPNRYYSLEEAFDWKSSPEGYEFWRNLRNEFEDSIL